MITHKGRWDKPTDTSDTGELRAPPGRHPQGETSAPLKETKSALGHIWPDKLAGGRHYCN